MSAKAYFYVVARDFGFAPNPFHGVCTLATCKPDIRRVANEQDWIIGMGGSRLKATGRCVFAMQVTAALSFDEYWGHPDYRVKRPVRNGSQKTMVGDNIYHREDGKGLWIQEDSHHSRPDGTADAFNVQADTRTNRVLLSKRFVYFGRQAAVVPSAVLGAIGYVNGRGHRTYPIEECRPMLEWLQKELDASLNTILGDPFDFDLSSSRYAYKGNKIFS